MVSTASALKMTSVFYRARPCSAICGCRAPCQRECGSHLRRLTPLLYTLRLPLAACSISLAPAKRRSAALPRGVQPVVPAPPAVATCASSGLTHLFCAPWGECSAAMPGEERGRCLKQKQRYLFMECTALRECTSLGSQRQGRGSRSKTVRAWQSRWRKSHAVSTRPCKRRRRQEKKNIKGIARAQTTCASCAACCCHQA